MSLLDGLLGGIGFLTTLPVGKSDRLAHLQKHTYIFPVVGIIVGLLIGAVGTILFVLLPGQPGVLAVFVIISIYVLTGFHHIDGLSDLGDGITAHGSREKKIGAMKDNALGAGGVVFIVLYILAMFVTIQALASLRADTGWGYVVGAALLAAEISSKHSMLTVGRLGRSIHQGMGSMITENTGPKQFAISLAISALACAAVLGIAGIAALVAAMAASLLIVIVARRHFGGINGDCLGASNELGRLAALGIIFLLYRGGIVLWMPW